MFEQFADVERVVVDVVVQVAQSPRSCSMLARSLPSDWRRSGIIDMVNLCALALPRGTRADGLPVGVQLVAPAFADRPLLDLGALLLGEPTGETPPLAADRSLLAVCGAHLAGQPLNPILLEAGGRLHRAPAPQPATGWYA